MGLLPFLDIIATVKWYCILDNTKVLSKFLWLSPFLLSQLLPNGACHLDIWVSVIRNPNIMTCSTVRGHKSALVVIFDLQMMAVKRAALFSESWKSNPVWSLERSFLLAGLRQWKLPWICLQEGIVHSPGHIRNLTNLGLKLDNLLRGMRYRCISYLLYVLPTGWLCLWDDSRGTEAIEQHFQTSEVPKLVLAVVSTWYPPSVKGWIYRKYNTDSDTIVQTL